MTETRTLPPRPTGEIGARVVLIDLPEYPGRPNSAMSPRGGFADRITDRFYPNLKEIDGPFVNGCIAFTWQDSDKTDQELIDISVTAVHEEMAFSGEWDGYGGYPAHGFRPDPEDDELCGWKPYDAHGQLDPCGYGLEEH